MDVNDGSWEREVLNHDGLVVVDFWHPKCQWCVVLDPVFAEISREFEGRAKFVKMNVFETQNNKEIAVGYGVMATPTLGFFCDGRAIEIVAGFQPKERLKTLVEDVLSKHQECAKQSTKLER